MSFSSDKSHSHLTENMISRCLATFGKKIVVDHVSNDVHFFCQIAMVLYSGLFNKFSVLTLEKLIFIVALQGCRKEQKFGGASSYWWA